MLDWKDETSYSQGETASRTPRVWRAEIGRLSVVVHRLHRIPDTWFYTCEGLRISQYQAGADLAEAQQQAEAAVRQYLRDAALAIGLRITEGGE